MSVVYNLELFGVLKEIAETDKIKIQADSTLNKESLLIELYKKYPAFKVIQCQLAVNHKLSDGAFSEEDHLVLLPPFSGG